MKNLKEQYREINLAVCLKINDQCHQAGTSNDPANLPRVQRLETSVMQ